MGSYIDDAYKDEIYKSPKWEPTARKYEREFAANLYRSDLVQQTAKSALVKLSTILNAYYASREHGEALDHVINGITTGQLTEDVQQGVAELNQVAALVAGEAPRPTAVLEAALLSGVKNNRTSAGQIGNAVLELEDNASQEEREQAHEQNFANLSAVINEDGNVREQMTMLYNGTFINGGRTNNEIAHSQSLKNLLANITVEDVKRMRVLGMAGGNETLKNLNIDFDMLDAFSGQRGYDGDMLDSVPVSINMRQESERKKGKGTWLGRKIRALYRAAKDGINYKLKRKAKPADTEGHGEAYYNNLGLNLSAREAAYGKNQEGKLLWKEGSAWGEYSTPVTDTGMVHVMGTSGTTLRMMAAFKFLGASKQELLNFRLALMAWMVTAEDHSIYEVLCGSHLMGVKGYENVDDAIEMYQTIAPLSRDEIRNEYAPDRRFPHETVYIELLDDIARRRAEGHKKENVLMFSMGKESEQYAKQKYQNKLKPLAKNHGDAAGKYLEALMSVRKRFVNKLGDNSFDDEVARHVRDDMLNEMYSRIDNYFGKDAKIIFNMTPWELHDWYLECGEETKKIEKQIETLSKQLAKKQGSARAHNAEEQESISKDNQKLEELRELKNQYEQETNMYLYARDYMALGEMGLVDMENGEDVSAFNIHSLQEDVSFIKDENIQSNVKKDKKNENTAALYNAQQLALNIYTTGAYQAMTVGATLGKTIGHWFFNATVNNESDTKEKYFLRADETDMQDGELLKMIESAIRLSSRFSQDTYREKSSIYGEKDAANDVHNIIVHDIEDNSFFKGTVYRGGRYSKGAESGFETGSLTSTSESLGAAMVFYNNAMGKWYNFKKGLLMRMEMTGLSGLSIKEYSNVRGEEEVLVPVGTRFTATGKIHPEIYDTEQRLIVDKAPTPDRIKEVEDNAVDAKAGGKNPVETVVNVIDLKETSAQIEKQRNIAKDKRKKVLRRKAAFAHQLQ